jgi:hypothetical protein
MSQLLTPKESGSTPAMSPSCFAPDFRRKLWPCLAMVAVLAVTVYQLHSQGRLWWCACGQPYLWAGDTQSSHNSQHLFDPYSFLSVVQ